jgi:hypothetical protein
MQTSPPKFVPTLTQVVQPSATTPSTAAAAASTTPSFAAASPAKGQLTDALTLQIQQRVLQHVTDHVMRQIQTTLERQIREAVAGVALTHATLLRKTWSQRLKRSSPALWHRPCMMH